MKATADGWVGVKNPQGRNHRWHSEALGATIFHCGHPTAISPYYTSATPGTFRTLQAAKDAVSALRGQKQ